MINAYHGEELSQSTPLSKNPSSGIYTSLMSGMPIFTHQAG